MKRAPKPAETTLQDAEDDGEDDIAVIHKVHKQGKRADKDTPGAAKKKALHKDRIAKTGSKLSSVVASAAAEADQTATEHLPSSAVPAENTNTVSPSIDTIHPPAQAAVSTAVSNLSREELHMPLQSNLPSPALESDQHNPRPKLSAQDSQPNDSTDEQHQQQSQGSGTRLDAPDSDDLLAERNSQPKHDLQQPPVASNVVTDSAVTSSSTAPVSTRDECMIAGSEQVLSTLPPSDVVLSESSHQNAVHEESHGDQLQAPACSSSSHGENVTFDKTEPVDSSALSPIPEITGHQSAEAIPAPVAPSADSPILVAVGDFPSISETHVDPPICHIADEHPSSPGSANILLQALQPCKQESDTTSIHEEDHTPASSAPSPGHAMIHTHDGEQLASAVTDVTNAHECDHALAVAASRQDAPHAESQLVAPVAMGASQGSVSTANQDGAVAHHCQTEAVGESLPIASQASQENERPLRRTLTGKMIPLRNVRNTDDMKDSVAMPTLAPAFTARQYLPASSLFSTTFYGSWQPLVQTHAPAPFSLSASLLVEKQRQAPAASVEQQSTTQWLGNVLWNAGKMAVNKAVEITATPVHFIQNVRHAESTLSDAVPLSDTGSVGEPTGNEDTGGEHDFELLARGQYRLREFTSEEEHFITFVGKLAKHSVYPAECASCSALFLAFSDDQARPRWCTFTGRYYCAQCHVGERSVIPSRVMNNWDFALYEVSVAAARFIRDSYADALLSRLPLMTQLRTCPPQLRVVHDLRLQLVRIRRYVLSCGQSVPLAQSLVAAFARRKHLLVDESAYSMADLVQIRDGELQTELSQHLTACLDHVRSCARCSQAGYVCKVCQSPAVIFPYEVYTVQRCLTCRAYLHKTCFGLGEVCAVCAERDVRSSSTSTV
jgi:hypothetical protein